MTQPRASMPPQSNQKLNQSAFANMNMHMNETRMRVRYAETDQMGVVYHANHFIWFEVGRVELLRQFGFSYKDMEREDDCCIAVVDARCRYKAPVHYDDEIVVRTYLKRVRERSSTSDTSCGKLKLANCWRKAKRRTLLPIQN